TCKGWTARIWVLGALCGPSGRSCSIDGSWQRLADSTGRGKSLRELTFGIRLDSDSSTSNFLRRLSRVPALAACSTGRGTSWFLVFQKYSGLLHNPIRHRTGPIGTFRSRISWSKSLRAPCCTTRTAQSYVVLGLRRCGRYCPVSARRRYSG